MGRLMVGESVGPQTVHCIFQVPRLHVGLQVRCLESSAARVSLLYIQATALAPLDSSWNFRLFEVCLRPDLRLVFRS